MKKPPFRRRLFCLSMQAGYLRNHAKLAIITRDGAANDVPDLIFTPAWKAIAFSL